MPPDAELQVAQAALDNQRTVDGLPFPLVLCCSSRREHSAADSIAAVEHWVRARQEELVLLATTHGAVLFRGFPLADAAAFDGFVAAFDLPNFPYEQSLSNAVRVNRTERVFTANEAPPEVNIFLHHEMAQTPIFPSRIFFFCEQPAERGGATPICRSDELLARLTELRPEFVRKCEQQGLRYSTVMPSSNDATSGMGRSWQSTLRAETREQAEARLRQLDYSWQWLDNGCLRAMSPVLPAVYEVSPGRRTFFNQLIAAFRGWKDSRNDPSKSIRHGDDTPLDGDAVMQAAQLADELTVDVRWQRGDVALLDNFVAMHGRRTFQGTRKVLASLASPTAVNPALLL